MAWTVAELERRLALADRNGAASHARPAPADEGGTGSAGGAAEAAVGPGELDVLRQALVQEHEARRRVESGESLARAHAEIERLTVLLEQARHERERGGGVQTDPHIGRGDAS
jgi:hypothetical protein